MSSSLSGILILLTESARVIMYILAFAFAVLATPDATALGTHYESRKKQSGIADWNQNSPESKLLDSIYTVNELAWKLLIYVDPIVNCKSTLKKKGPKTHDRMTFTASGALVNFEPNYVFAHKDLALASNLTAMFRAEIQSCRDKFGYNC